MSGSLRPVEVTSCCGHPRADRSCCGVFERKSRKRTHSLGANRNLGARYLTVGNMYAGLPIIVHIEELRLLGSVNYSWGLRPSVVSVCCPTVPEFKRVKHCLGFLLICVTSSQRGEDTIKNARVDNQPQ